MNIFSSRLKGTLALLCGALLGLSVLTQPVSAQNAGKSAGETILVNGSVSDDSKEPLPGAYVFVDETRQGSVTDINGNFSVVAPVGGHLTVSFVGMLPQKVAIEGRSRINVILSTDSETLKDVLVTGYQSLSKERSAGAFRHVFGAEIQDKAAARGSILESLDGIAAGLAFKNNEEAEKKYLIRGLTSVVSNVAPLFVIDGVAVSADDVDAFLNSTDVLSVSVLKDATAASIWGSQAANGVVVIETKTGYNTHNKFKVNYTGSFTYKGMPDYEYMDMMDSQTFIRNAREIFDMTKDNYTYEKITTSNAGATKVYVRNPLVMPHEQLMYDWAAGDISEAEMNSGLDRLASLNQREQVEKYLMSKAWNTIHNISIQGGNEKSQLFTSFTYDGNKGNDKDYTNNAKVNIREVYNVNKNIKLDLGLNAGISSTMGHRVLSSSDARAAQYTFSYSDLPYAVFYDADGNAMDHSVYDMGAALKQSAESTLGCSLDYYPVEDFLSTINNRTTTSIRANLGLTIKIWDGLRYEGRFAYERRNTNGEVYTPGDTYFIRYARGCAYNTTSNAQVGPTTGGDYTTTSSINSDWTLRNQLAYDKAWETHQVTALAGFEFRERYLSGITSFKRGYDYQTMTTSIYDLKALSNGVGKPLLYPCMCTAPSMSMMVPLYWPNSYDSFSTSDSRYRYFSAYANAAYTYDRRYSLNASVRVDQSNLFGSDPSVQFRPVWSFGAAWNAKNEEFLKNASWISKLGVRLSYGIGGNSPDPTIASPYTILTAATNTYYPGQTYNIKVASNDRITWEKTSTLNFGVDFSMFRHRLYGSIDLYSKKTTDLLGLNPVDPTNGKFSSVYTNNGTITNKGIEFNIAGDIIRTRSFSWNSSLVFAYNKNMVEEYYQAPWTMTASVTSAQYKEGYPYGTIWATKWAGLNPENGAPRVYNKDGEIVENYSKLTVDDFYCLGTRFAPINGSWSNIFRYKGLSLSMMFVYSTGGKLLNDVLRQKPGRSLANLSNDFDRRWRNPGDELKTNIPSIWTELDKTRNGNNEINMFMYSDINVLDGSYIKLRELKLAYDLPSSFSRKIAMSSASCFVQANNLCYWAANKEGVDPEYISINGYARTSKLGPIFTIGLNLNF